MTTLNKIIESDNYLHILININLVLDGVRPAFLLECIPNEIQNEQILSIDSKLKHKVLHHLNGHCIGTLFYVNANENDLLVVDKYIDEQVGELLGYPECLSPMFINNTNHFTYMFNVVKDNVFVTQIFAFHTTKQMDTEKYYELCHEVEKSIGMLQLDYELECKILERFNVNYYINKIKKLEHFTEDELYDLSLFLANNEDKVIFEMLQQNLFKIVDEIVTNLSVLNKLLRVDPFKTIILMLLFTASPKLIWTEQSVLNF
jgi:hypothetical protein